MSGKILSKAAFKAVKTAIHEVKDGRNQSYAAEQRAREFFNDNGHLEQQSPMRNFGRPYKPSDKEGEEAHTSPPHIAKTVASNFIRSCQFALSLTVAGLYGQDLHHACDKNVYLDAKWVFAEIVAALGAFTSAGYLLIWCCVQRIARPALTSYYSMHFPLFLWEIVMCLIWMIVFGIFGKMYLPEHPEGDLDIVRMKHACWVDLVNLLLWAATMIWSGLRWWQGRIRKSKEEGESAAAGVRDPSEAMRKLKFDDGSAPAGAPSGTPAGTGPGGHAAPPVASGAAPVVSRQNSRESAYESSEERVVSP
ncbi:hypothetical protein DPV78_001635 [Talaromyces pinophilus]|nr:hypothetical protein DPV78_001635 [Talaromyces pinophilus]